MEDALYTLAIVDDSQTIRRLLSEYLPPFGFEIVCSAKNGREFLAYLAQAETLPELCLLDINMPVMDGFETAMHLRAKYPSIRILGFSTDNGLGRAEKLLACGAHGFTLKDIDTCDLAAKLKALLATQTIP